MPLQFFCFIKMYVLMQAYSMPVYVCAQMHVYACVLVRKRELFVHHSRKGGQVCTETRAFIISLLPLPVMLPVTAVIKSPA